ncbi:MAG: geranylgeranyl reductase family protein [Fibrobacterota bacterium]
MSNVYDVIVVGAGPAGSRAACIAAQAGRSVALFERAEWPSQPVRCGEGVGIKGMDTSIGIEKHWILSKIEGVDFVAPDGTAVRVEKLGPDSYCIDRTLMDRELVERAIAAGAEYINTTYIDDVCDDPARTARFLCRAGKNKYFGRVLIIADGVESRVKRFLGWKDAVAMEDMETCAFARVRHSAIDGSTLRFHVGENIAPGGYLWVFPRGEGSANVGLGVLGRTSAAGKARTLLDEFIAREYPGAAVSHRHCGGVPVAAWTRPLVRGGALLAGDAAGQVNALNGGGIAYALFAGEAAGRAAVGAFGADGTVTYRKLHAYEREWKRYCGKNQQRSYALKTALLNRRDRFFNDLAASLSREDPRKLSYLRVFARVFARNPRLLLKTFFLFS